MNVRFDKIGAANKMGAIKDIHLQQLVLTLCKGRLREQGKWNSIFRLQIRDIRTANSSNNIFVLKGETSGTG
jgi:hypothetical protein